LFKQYTCLLTKNKENFIRKRTSKHNTNNAKVDFECEIICAKNSDFVARNGYPDPVTKFITRFQIRVIDTRFALNSTRSVKNRSYSSSFPIMHISS